MIKIKIAYIIFFVGIIFFLVYKVLLFCIGIKLGELELLLDDIFNTIIKTGVIIYLLPIFNIYEDFINRNKIK